MFGKNNKALLSEHLDHIPHIICAASLRNDADDLVASLFARCKVAVIDDKYTVDALGNRVFAALQSRFSARHVMLEGAVVADNETVEWLRKASSSCDLLVAVGSGTVSDICKYAAFLDNKPYIIFPTAASMNGYLSANASITVDGYKKTVAARMPAGVFCDLSVIASAPERLHKSGLGDALARSTAQADWLLSHLLLHTPYNDIPFELLKELEPELLDNARGIGMSDSASIELLLHTLLLSGLGMTIAHGSYPASQAEHMIAHAYGMLADSTMLHGEEIGVTTLAMSRRQETLLRTRPAIQPLTFPKNKIVELFGERTAAEAEKSYAIKQALCTEISVKEWDTIAGRIEQVMLPSTQIHSVLTAARAPDTPEKLGWDMGIYDIALTHARFLRDRFTFLDLQ